MLLNLKYLHEIDSSFQVLNLFHALNSTLDLSFKIYLIDNTLIVDIWYNNV